MRRGEVRGRDGPDRPCPGPRLPGPDDGTCAAAWQGAGLCLVVEDDTRTLAAALPDPDATLELALEAGTSRIQATLYALDSMVACDPGLGAAGACVAEAGCQIAWHVAAFTAEAGPLTLDFAAPACDAAWPIAPPTERCDGGDDDCDGAVDEDFALSMACTVGEGACARPGERRCGPDGQAACAGTPGEPVDEIPGDGLDNDCDGETDEVAAECQPGDRIACGADAGVCQAGSRTCDAEGRFGPCVDAGGHLVVLPGDREEACNGEDDDCDGSVDEAFRLPDGPAVGEPCEGGLGVCAGIGRVICAPDGAACDLPMPVGGPEQCNALDDDCDGRVDEDLGVGDACAEGVGACRIEGRIVCRDEAAVCDAVAAEPGTERCDAPADEDCDGSADEGFDGLGDGCAVGQGACERNGTVICAADGVTVACNIAPGDPEVEACNLLDDDCDGATDEDFDTASDPANCGECGRLCALPDATAGCEAGECVVDACAPGFADVDQVPANGCECRPGAVDAPDPAFEDVNCDGVDGPADRAVFVAGPDGDDGAAGTLAAPVSTVARGVALAAERGGGPVLIVAGRHVLDATLEVPGGVDLHGGYLFDPAGPAWSRVSAAQAATELVGPSPVLVYRDLAALTRLDLVQVRSQPAPAGENAIAILAENVQDFLWLQDCLVVAGAAGAGRPGQDGDAAPDVAAIGRSGADGDDAGCPGCGGPPGMNPACPLSTSGGAGGRSIDDPAQADGAPGVGDLPGARPASPSPTRVSRAATAARNRLGPPGLGSRIGGRLDRGASAWRPDVGEPGGIGTPGSGGGGGGAGATVGGLPGGGGAGGGARGLRRHPAASVARAAAPLRSRRAGVRSASPAPASAADRAAQVAPVAPAAQALRAQRRPGRAAGAGLPGLPARRRRRPGRPWRLWRWGRRGGRRSRRRGLRAGHRSARPPARRRGRAGGRSAALAMARRSRRARRRRPRRPPGRLPGAGNDEPLGQTGPALCCARAPTASAACAPAWRCHDPRPRPGAACTIALPAHAYDPVAADALKAEADKLFMARDYPAALPGSRRPTPSIPSPATSPTRAWCSSAWARRRKPWRPSTASWRRIPSPTRPPWPAMWWSGCGRRWRSSPIPPAPPSAPSTTRSWAPPL
ncbi:MAG: MopE-related protein [bacterium]